jgi:hypothetical protein
MIMLSLLAVFAASALASASASAAPLLEWLVCEELPGAGVEPPTKYDNHLCNTKAKPLAERKWEWKLLAAGETRNVDSHGGEFVLNAGKPTENKCTLVEDKGDITGGKPGTDLALEIKFTGCTTPKELTCKVKSKSPPDTRAGTIIVTNIPTDLEDRLIGGVFKVVDNFLQKLVGTTKEFVTLEFGTEEVEQPAGSGKFVLQGVCVKFPATTKIKGSIAAETGNGTGLLNFPEPGIEKDSLEAFGLTATLKGQDTQLLENGWAVTAL